MPKYLTVTVDCDNDAIELSEMDDKGKHISSFRQSATSMNKLVGIVENLLHLLDAQGVILQTQDEGQLHHIGEW